MRISVSGLSKKAPIFGSDKFLKINHDRTQNKYTVEVKDNLSTGDRISRFFSNAFGTEYRKISSVLNSHEGQARLKQVGNKNVRVHLEEINQKIEKLNKKLLVRQIPLINIPEFSKTTNAKKSNDLAPAPKTISPTPKPLPKKPNEYIISFYAGMGTDVKNRTLDTIWNYSHIEKESIHNYIQWLFPLAKGSAFNNQAPQLDSNLIAAMKSTPNMLINLQKSLDVMLEFYGLEWNEDQTAIKMSDAFDTRAKVWLTPDNHNHLRLTRILTCLRLFDLNSESAALFACLKEIDKQYPRKISQNTFAIWSNTQAL